jgi:outer membrane protein OmpA-like peptidoglycan-associated protein
MQRVALLLVLAALGIAVADPALGGGRGLFRLYDARVEDDGALAWGNHVVLHRYFDTLGTGRVRGPAYGMELSYAPFECFEAWGSLLGVVENCNNRWCYDYQGFGLGGKLGLPYLPVFKPAFVVSYRNEHTGYLQPEFMSGLDKAGADWRLVGALRLWEVHKTLPNIIFNYGRGFADGSNAFLGTGIELSTNAFDVFLEASSEQAPGKSFLVDPVRSTLTPGVRIKVPYFHLTGGVELGLNHEPNQFIAGFNLVSPFPKPKPKPWGQLAGRVEDELTGEPLAATIRFKNRRYPALKCDDENGTFYTTKGPCGSLILEASAKGYRSDIATLVVPEFGNATYTFKLRSAHPVGSIVGRVFDAKTSRPLAAKVTVGDRTTEASPNTGFFRFDSLPEGLTTVSLEMEGYDPEVRAADVDQAHTARLDIPLREVVAETAEVVSEPSVPTGIFKGKVMSSDGRPLAATITMGGKAPDITAANNGLFAAQIPAGPYEINISAPNHQAQFGVVNIDSGVTVERYFVLTALAPGESSGPVPIKKPVIFTLRGVLFDFNRATLREDAYPNLQEAVRILKESPDIRIEVQGFTCSIGSDEYNYRLSQRRAESVVEYLVYTGGIERSRLVARGYGETQFVASNETEEGRQQNRRVEFVIVQ